MITYNNYKIICVETRKCRPSKFYNYREEQKFLGFTTRKAGFYGILDFYHGDTLPERHKLVNGLVYEYAKVVIYYEGDIRRTFSFRKNKEARQFAKKILRKYPWLGEKKRGETNANIHI